MQHPFQCIATARPSNELPLPPGYLLAACGPELTSISLDTGDIVSTWNSLGLPGANTPPDGEREDGPPAKKLKSAHAESGGLSASDIIKLVVSPNQQHVITITSDKYIRVFSIESNGVLSEMNARCMPKRPCAIQILPDDATLICGDKFGDVYSLPLIEEPNSNHQGYPGLTTAQYAKQTETASFKPSATSKTVHTQRNLKSLAAQQSQQNLTPKTKGPLAFKHELLLGHVSMLTDLVHTSSDVAGKKRSYILTADRDEHIRISRAPPQSHVIEGYCLGHKEFISKICLVPNTELLISGGGDDWIGVWDWLEFTLRRRISLPAIDPSSGTPAVSGMWVMPSDTGDILVVSCERMTRLLFMPVDRLLDAQWDSAELERPILDMMSIGGTVVLSLDARDGSSQRLQAYKFATTEAGALSMIPDSSPDHVLMQMNALASSEKDAPQLDELLYGVEKLRKRGVQEEVDDG